MIKLKLSYLPKRKKPEEGDRRHTKKYGLQIRVQDRALDFAGQPYARVFSNGRPVYSWHCIISLPYYARHLLTEEERKVIL